MFEDIHVKSGIAYITWDITRPENEEKTHDQRGKPN
jgi:hypothetical protein